MKIEEMMMRAEEGAARAADLAADEDDDGLEVGDVLRDRREHAAAAGALAADVLALIAEVEGLTNLVCKAGTEIVATLKERDAALLKAQIIEDGAADTVIISHEEARAVAAFIRGSGYDGPVCYGALEERLSAALAAR